MGISIWYESILRMYGNGHFRYLHPGIGCRGRSSNDFRQTVNILQPVTSRKNKSNI